MACKLYYQTPDHVTMCRSFSTRKVAEAFWERIKEPVCKMYGCEIKPIFVETGSFKGSRKGRG